MTRLPKWKPPTGHDQALEAVVPDACTFAPLPSLMPGGSAGAAVGGKVCGAAVSCCARVVPWATAAEAADSRARPPSVGDRAHMPPPSNEPTGETICAYGEVSDDAADTARGAFAALPMDAPSADPGPNAFPPRTELPRLPSEFALPCDRAPRLPPLAARRTFESADFCSEDPNTTDPPPVGSDGREPPAEGGLMS